MIHRLTFSAALMILVGCSNDPKSALVSGVVTVDGKPYPNAVVSFQPVGTKENPAPGRGSSAYTNENGRYEMISAGGGEGAIVGKQRVRIMTRGDEVERPLLEGGSSSDETNPKKITVDPIPPEWNSASTKEFDVPAGGTDQANFDIISRKRK